MSTSVSTLDTSTKSKSQLKFHERLFIRLIEDLHFSCLRVEFPGNRVVIIGNDAMPLQDLKIEDVRFFKSVFWGGDVGFGEAYVNGYWSTTDLSGLILLLAKEKAQISRLHRGLSFLALLYNRLHHIARSNTLARSKHNIQAHYDLSNDFYKSFLDPTMTYSSALFLKESDSLEQAQINKIDRMLDLAEVKSGDSILEIGTGWGALAIRAAQRGYRVKTITLSGEQYSFAKKQFEAVGVANQIELHLQDYRTLEGQFDAVISCEMIEAVGKEYLSDYFRTVKQSLKNGAKAVIQSITISDDRYEEYSRECDWIQKYIFPGGHLPSIGAICSHVNKVGGTVVSSVDSFGKDYSETLRRWADRFNANRSKVMELGFDAAFCRKWNYYLSYCEAGFEAGMIDVNHVTLKRDYQ